MAQRTAETRNSQRIRRLQVATWAVWCLSLVLMPLTAYLFTTFIPPDKDDDFGMGPFLSGAMLGGLLSVLAGIVSLVLGIQMRALRPLSNRWLSVFERVVLVSPPAGVLALAAGFIGGNPIGAIAVYLAAAALALVQLRQGRHHPSPAMHADLET